MAKTLRTNEGAQREFVKNPHRASAYIGGLGSGKTWAGIVRGLDFSQQPVAPDTMWGPRGLIGASSYGVLRKVIQPQFFEVMEGTDLWKTGKRTTSWVKSEMKARLIASCSCPDRHACDHEVEIFLASLDDPDELRGMELSWFYIDEGRNTTRNAWEVLWGRLRQQGYRHAGWVCSTPNGFDWMYDNFHPDSPIALPDAMWYGAPTYENKHLPPEYIAGLEAQYQGRFFEQEVLGRFVGMTQGAVFFAWNPRDAADEVLYDATEPFYSEWDFGMGDQNVVLFFQLAWHERRKPGMKEALLVPEKRYIGAMEAAERTTAEWAKAFHAYCNENFDGRRPKTNIGDPAGRQRNQVTGTSVITDLAAHGIRVAPAPQKPVDYAVRILNNMMEDHRVKVDRARCLRLSQALSSHKWKLDSAGTRTSNTPVHDWTSHYCDAVRYGTTVLIPERPVTVAERPKHGFEPGTYGNVFEQVLRNAEAERQEGWLGPQPTREVEWTPGIIRPRSS